jgi:phenylacetate-CoA ligase
MRRDRFWNEPAETMGPGAMRAAQGANLAETVRWVYERVPFYRQALDDTGVKPADIRSVEDVARLPFTTKNDLRDQYPFGLCAVPLADVVRIHASSGTTGKPITGPYTADDMRQWTECMARTLWSASVRPGDVVQNAYGMGLFTGGLGFHQGAAEIGCAVVPAGPGLTERQLLLLQDFGVHALFCTPSYALTIAERAGQLGIDLRALPLRVGCFGAEPWTEKMRDDIEARMGIVAHEAYGLTEMMGPGVAFSCEARGLHINEDHCYPEIVDPATLEPVPPGERGELVFTALQRRAMPLLRYRTRDITRLRREPCACGRTLVSMDKILGRSDDMLIISGVNVFPSQVEALIFEVDGFQPLYQIRVTKEGYLDRLAVEVEARPDVYASGDEAVAQRGRALEHHCRSIMGLGVEVRVLAAGAIARSEGKARRVIDER